ncbi:MAG: type IV toxin-antitoxin system AbiEi family antitoxin domain-containing protein [Actinobacteria bacterium]|jgi:hypothetical protein|nr:type IV toxin-antitoxin system AbiEi family antitoxin domain-containing protein [Actinomycetota bacterium]
MTSIDERAIAIARKQRGLLTRHQLEDAGVSTSTIARRIRRGRWIEPVPGVVDLTTHQASWHKGLQQILLATGPESWVSHGTAAHLHDFLDRLRPNTYDVVVRRGSHTTVGALDLHTTTRLAPDETTTVLGLRCTSRARTLLDLAPTLTLEELERLTLDLGRRDPTAFRHLADLLARYPRAGGRRRLLTVIARLPDDLTKLGSPVEGLLVPELLRHGAPMPKLQFPVRDLDGAFIKRVDAAWEDEMHLVEIDGHAYHDTSGARRADEEARGTMRAVGWTVHVLRREDLGGDAPARIAAEVLAAIARRTGTRR